MKKIPVTFSPMYDLYFADEIQHLSSGAAPNGSGTLVLRNSEVDVALLSDEVRSAGRDAWEKGNLESFVRQHFFPVGRAQNLRFWRNEDEE